MGSAWLISVYLPIHDLDELAGEALLARMAKLSKTAKLPKAMPRPTSVVKPSGKRVLLSSSRLRIQVPDQEFTMAILAGCRR